MNLSFTRLLLSPLAAALVLTAPDRLQAEHIMDSVDALTSTLAGTQSQFERGDFSDAVTTSQKAVQLAQDRFGPLHPSVAPYFDNLAVVDQALARYADAESNFKWALALREKSLGSMDPAVASSLVSLAYLEEQLGRFEEADLSVQRALAIEKSSKTTSVLIMADSLMLAEDIQDHLGADNQAVSYLKQALLETTGSGSDLGPVQAQALTRLAGFETTQKNFTQAESHLQQALQITQKTAAPTDIRIADALKSLADFYAVTGNQLKANDFYTQTLSRDLHYIGVEDTYSNIPYHQRGADAYFALGQWKDAEALDQRILKIKIQVYGPAHPEVALSLESLAQTEQRLQNKAEAVKDLKSALEILKKYFSPDHPLVQDAQNRLAALLK